MDNNNNNPLWWSNEFNNSSYLGDFGYSYNNEEPTRHSSYVGEYEYSYNDQEPPRHSSYAGEYGYSYNVQEPQRHSSYIGNHGQPDEPVVGSFIDYMQHTIRDDVGGSQTNDDIQFGFPPLSTRPTFPGTAPEFQSRDYTEEFCNDLVWKTKKEAIQWAKDIAIKLNFVLKVGRTQSSSFFQMGYVALRCIRERKDPPKKTPKKTSKTGRCDCKFGLDLHEGPRGEWRMKVREGKHNHSFGEDLIGVPLAGRLKEEQLVKVREMLDSHCRPHSIMTELNKNPNNYTTKKQLYNTIYKIRTQKKEKRTVVQEFFYRCKENRYFLEYRINPSTNELQDVFFAHPECMDLLREFPYIAVLDCTYSVIRSNNPFLEIIGVTNSGKNFTIVGCFLSGETNDPYIWAIQQLKELYRLVDRAPVCLVTDREQALINAMDSLFPDAKFILCRRHIRKNIEAHALKTFKDKEIATAFSSAYYGLFKKKTEASYYEELNKIVNTWSRCTHLHKYMEAYWLAPHKDRIVSAWTDTVFNLKTHTTNRVEGAHGALKNYLTSSKGNISTVWNEMHDMLCKLVKEVKGTFNISMQKMIRGKGDKGIFRSLCFVVSGECILRLSNEYDKGVDPKCDRKCSCMIRSRDGLPCVHEMAPYVRNEIPLPLSSVHPFWRTLSLQQDPLDIDVQKIRRDVYKSKMDEFVHNDFNNLSLEEQARCLYEMNRIAHPEQTDVHDFANVKHKGRPSGARNKAKPPPPPFGVTKRVPSHWEHVEEEVEDMGTPPKKPRNTRKKTVPEEVPSHFPNHLTVPKLQTSKTYFRYLPKFLIQHIVGWYEIVSDGNCGYRAIAFSMGDSEESWVNIRELMMFTTKTEWDVLERTMTSPVTMHAMLLKLHFLDRDCFAPKPTWFEVPDMGIIASTALNMILVIFSKVGSSTYPPIRARPDYVQGQMLQIVCLGYVKEENHWIAVLLDDECPLPPITCMWGYHREESALQLIAPYMSRLQSYIDKLHAH